MGKREKKQKYKLELLKEITPTNLSQRTWPSSLYAGAVPLRKLPVDLNFVPTTQTLPELRIPEIPELWAKNRTAQKTH